MVLVAALAILASGGYAVYAALQPGLAVAPSPASQIVSQGQAATYTVTVNRLNGLTGPVTLKAGNLPAGVTASWDGVVRSSLSVPAGVNVATLKLQTSSTTKVGTAYPAITATSGSITRLTAITMVVESLATPNFTLAAVPASRTVLQGDSTGFSVSLGRAGGFTGPVKLGVTGLPAGIAATWRLPNGTVATGGAIPAGVASATLELVTQRATPTGSFQLAILGTAKPAATTVTRFAAATLVVQPTLSFQIAGTPPTLMAPGVRAPLDLRLTNPYSFPLKVSSLAVGVEEATSRPGCSGTANFRATGPRVAGFVLPAQAKDVPLSTLIGAGSLPTVEMLDTDSSQNACVDTAVTLQYSGSASR